MKFKRFTQTGLVLNYIDSRMKKKDKMIHVLMIVFNHLQFLMLISAPTSVYIEFILLSQEWSHQVRKI